MKHLCVLSGAARCFCLCMPGLMQMPLGFNKGASCQVCQVSPAGNCARAVPVPDVALCWGPEPQPRVEVAWSEALWELQFKNREGPREGPACSRIQRAPSTAEGKRESKERNSSSQGASWSRDPAANAAGHCFPLGWGLSPIRHVLTPPTRPAASREGAGPEQPAPQWNRGCVPEDCTPPRPTQPPVLSGRMCSLHHLHPHQA